MFSGVNFIVLLLTSLKVFFNIPIEFSIFLFLIPVSALIFYQLDLFGMKFELENINKWSTPSLMMRYCRTMRILCKSALNGNHQHAVLLQGYVDVHRQKCEMSGCPYRQPASNFQNQSFNMIMG